VIYINQDFKVKHEDNVSKAQNMAAEIVNQCKKEALAKINDDGNSAEETVGFLNKCIELSNVLQKEETK
jgi:hypothetical protein